MTANPTGAEARLWEVLEPLGFARQVTMIGNTRNGLDWQYILDFYHFDLKLCVEVDGRVHRKTKGRDRRRDSRLAGEGIETIRFTNKQVTKELEWVMGVVKASMQMLESAAAYERVS